ncbi:MAG: cytochrome c oxidase assembly protein subunit 15 [Moritella sp.]|jgi:cytochrome c oxidase assembly protein subunit 15
MLKLINVTMLLALLVIALGAYTRLTDAGLGCPDWPGCYGFNVVPQTSQDITAAQQAYPDNPVNTDKAWNEMIHRYVAALLGLMIMIIFMRCARQKKHLALATSLALLVLFQAALGMWTVTLNLRPIIVMGHLLGGFSLLALLALFRLRLSVPVQSNTNIIQKKQGKRLARIHIFCSISLPILIIQIALGGWTSSNYAAIVCTEFPFCNGDWPSQFSLRDVFSLSPIADSYQYGVRDAIARMNIHITHRLWAVITLLYLLSAACLLLKHRPTKKIKMVAIILILILFLQVSLGVANVYFQLPIAVAVAHNLVAALLLITLIALLWFNQQQLQEAL